MKTKLSAFTLLEITISMLIVAVLMGFAYYALNTFQTILSSQQSKKLEQFGRDLFAFKAQQDCYQAKTISYNGRILSLNDSSGAIVYSFLDSIILRDQYQLHTDTFLIRHEPPEILFEDKDPDYEDLVSSIRLNLYFDSKLVPLMIKKEYDAQTLVLPDFTD